MSLVWSVDLKGGDRVEAVVHETPRGLVLNLKFVHAYSGSVYVSAFTEAAIRTRRSDAVSTIGSIRDRAPDALAVNLAAVQLVWKIPEPHTPRPARPSKSEVTFQLTLDVVATEHALIQERRRDQAAIQLLLARLEAAEERIKTLEGIAISKTLTV